MVLMAMTMALLAYYTVKLLLLFWLLLLLILLLCFCLRSTVLRKSECGEVALKIAVVFVDDVCSTDLILFWL